MSDLSLRAKQHGVLVLAEDVDRLFCQVFGGEVLLSDNPAARQFSLAFSRALNQISGVGSTGPNPSWIDYNHHLKVARGEDPKWREKMTPLTVMALRYATEEVVGRGLAMVSAASAADFLPPPEETPPLEETPSDAPIEPDLNDDLLEAAEALGLG